MTDPIARLLDEHRRIERVLEALVDWADGPASGSPGARAVLGRFGRFLREFADRAHHGKEEARLFRVLRDHDALPECGPINVYLHEHARGRAFVSGLIAIAGREGTPTTAERAEIRASAYDLAALLRAHIAREDRELFPAAARLLPADVLATLGNEFDAFDRDTFGADGYDALVALADRLAEVSRTEIDHEAHRSES